MAQPQLKRAIQLAQHGQAEHAVAILRELIKTNPQDLYAWLWLAECTTDTNEARFAARRVLELRPTQERALRILSELGTAGDVHWRPPWLNIKHKRNEVPEYTFGEKFKVGGFIVVAVGILLLAFVMFTDFPNMGTALSNNEAGQHNSNDKVALTATAQATSTTPFNLPESPEALTAQWLAEVLSGEQEVDLSFSCDDGEPSGLQNTFEPLAERLLTFGIHNLARVIQLEAVFDLLGVVDTTAEYEMEGNLVVTLFGIHIESPTFHTVIRFVSDQGQWAICEVSGQ
jgi:hypothetical protein